MSRVAPDFRPQRITACTISYIPDFFGYWKDSLKTLRVCLRSLRATTADLPVDIFVFDNGSCEEVKEFLLEEHRLGTISVLTLSSANLGKAGALNVLLPMCPGELIAYSDSDILFRRGWLERSLEVVETFPEAGMVTAMPTRVAKEVHDALCSATFQFAEQHSDVSVERGDLIDRHIILEHAKSVDKEPSLESCEDWLLTRKGVRVFAQANHFQFLIPKAVAMETLPLQYQRAMGGLGGGVRTLDTRLNERGYLRLSLPDGLVRHLGNTLSDEELTEAQDFIAAPPAPARDPSPEAKTDLSKAFLRQIGQTRLGRAVLRRAYEALFEAVR